MKILVAAILGLASNALWADSTISLSIQTGVDVVVNGVEVKGGEERSIVISDKDLEDPARSLVVRAAYNYDSEGPKRIVLEKTFSMRFLPSTLRLKDLEELCRIDLTAPQPCLFAIDEWLKALARVLSPAKADFARRLAKLAAGLNPKGGRTGLRDRDEHLFYGQLFLFNAMRALLENTHSAVIQTQVLPAFLKALDEANGLYWVKAPADFRMTPTITRLSYGVIQASTQALRTYDDNHDSFGDLQVALGLAVADRNPVAHLDKIEAALAAEQGTIDLLFESPHSTGLARVLMEQREILKGVTR